MQNVPKAYESKPNPHKEKSLMKEAQCKICPRHVSHENPTYMRRNLPLRRHKAKYA